MKQVWVTGAAGFFGRAVSALFHSHGWKVLGIGSSTPQKYSTLHTPFIAGTITIESFYEALRLTGPPDVVIHAAGSGAVGPSFQSPLNDFERSVVPTVLLLEILRKEAPKARVIFTSSAAVYGIQPDIQITEEVLPSPVSPYGAHKLISEILCRQSYLNNGQPTAIIRFFSIYGAGLRKQLLWDLANRLFECPAHLQIAGTGEETRDFIHVTDAARIALEIAEGAEFLILNGGSGRRTTVREVAEGLLQRLSPKTKLTFSGSVRPGDPPHFCADTTKLRQFDFCPKVDLERGLSEFVEWFKVNR